MFGTHLQGEKHRKYLRDNKDPLGLSWKEKNDPGFMIDTGNSTFGNNNLDKVRDSNLNNENKKIETIKLFRDTINDKNMELMRNYRFT